MVHKYAMNGYKIAVDSNSGAIHAVDDVVYDILEYYGEISRDEIVKKLSARYTARQVAEGYGEIEALVKEGLLFSEDDYIQAIDQVSRRNPVVKALCLHVAHDCNLRCGYCFAEEGEYHGKRSLMSFETGRKALDFILQNSGSRRNLEIDFFGGEPLMNFQVVKELVAYGRSQEEKYNKKFRFTITTNGVLLDEEKLDFINDQMHNLVLSIDGRKSVNDNMRKTVSGGGSYDMIMPKFIKAAQTRNQRDYYVRGTFTANNLDFSEDVMHLAGLGFKQISVEPVVADEAEPYALSERDVDRICLEYEHLAQEIMKSKAAGEDFNFFHFMIDLSGGPCVAKRLVGCGAGTEYLAVTPEGDLYPCHQFVGIDGFKMGDVDGGVQQPGLRETFENCHVYAKDDCRQCWAKFYCSGGCAANAYNQNGDLNKPYGLGCRLQRKRTECAIMLKVHESM